MGAIETAEDLSALIWSHPTARYLSLIGKYGPACIGFGLLIYMLLQWEKRRLDASASRPRPEPAAVVNWTHLLLVAAVAFASSSIAGLVIGRVVQAPKIFTNVAELAALGAVIVAYTLRLRRQQVAPEALPAWPAGLKHGLWYGCVGILAATLAALVSVLVLAWFGLTPQLQGSVRDIVSPSHPANPWLMAVLGVVIAPMWEESLFRGLLYPTLRKHFGATRGAAIGAAVVSSVLFSAMHWNLYAALPLFVMALVLCWAMERTNSLKGAVVAHALFNATSLLPLLALQF